MARLSYADPTTTREIAPDLIAQIQRERGDMLHIYAMLLNSPSFAEGWLTLLTAVRQKGVLDAGLRELMVLRIAALNGAAYEADQHRPIALASGVTEMQLAVLDTWHDSQLFDPRTRAALAYCDAMTRNVAVQDTDFAVAHRLFDARELTELTVTIAAYNMVSRVIVALGISSEDNKGNWK